MVLIISKKDLQQKAIRLRKEGKTYSEILRVVPVAKSSLLLWFKDVGLSTEQVQRITAKNEPHSYAVALEKRKYDFR